jgi:hypothetical protein
MHPELKGTENKEGFGLSFYIFKSYRAVLRCFFEDETARGHILDIDFINYRLYTYATYTQKMTKAAFELELKREFRTSTANIIEAYNYLKGIGFYDAVYNSAINCKKAKREEEESDY